ncbi:MAG TPA: hypothetical protein VIW92_06535 [Thermoanaerobaculia bacterium]
MDWKDILQALGIFALIAVTLGAIVLFVAWKKLRRLRVPPEADFFTTLRAVPLSLVVGLDLLDLGLDVLSSPIVWYILDRLNLKALRNVATVEAFVPFTGPIPTLTVSWFLARRLNLGQPQDPNLIETRRIGPDSYAPRPQRR